MDVTRGHLDMRRCGKLIGQKTFANSAVPRIFCLLWRRNLEVMRAHTSRQTWTQTDAQTDKTSEDKPRNGKTRHDKTRQRKKMRFFLPHPPWGRGERSKPGTTNPLMKDDIYSGIAWCHELSFSTICPSQGRSHTFFDIGFQAWI